MILRLNIRRGNLPATPFRLKSNTLAPSVSGGFTINGRAISNTSKKAVLMSGNDSFTFDVISPESTSDDAGIIEWTEIPKPGQLPWLVRSAKRLTKHSYKATIYKNGAPIDEELKRLHRMTGSDTEMVFSYGGYDTGRCRCLSMTIEPKIREAGTNNVVSAEVSFTLCSPNDLPTPKPVPNAPVPPTPTPEPPKGTPAQAQYTVKKGDTLWAIAQRFYGAGQSYPRIATANNIKDVNRIYPGQVLTIP